MEPSGLEVSANQSSSHHGLILCDSSFVGVAVMVAFLPIPGAIAKNIQRVQREVMKRTDVRVQVVTESKEALP